MMEQKMNSQWLPCEEEERVKTFKPHGRRATSFRQAHDYSQDVAVAEMESFEEHNEKIKTFSMSHTMLETNPNEPYKCSEPEDLATLNAPRIEKESVQAIYPVTKNRRLHLVPGCMLPRRRLSLN